VGRKFRTIDEWEIYVPGVDDGADRFDFDEEEAFTVELRFLSAREIKEYERILRKAKSQSEIAMVADEYARRMFVDNVRNVRNYAPRGVELTTAEEVWNDGEPDVINDITAAIRNRSRLEAGLVKKLRLESGTSCSPQSSSAGGDAPGATPPSTQTTQET